MSTVLTPPAPSPEPVFRLSVAQYHAMIENGVLDEDDPVELLEGVLIFKMPKKPKHRVVVRLLTTAIDRRLPHGWHLQAQDPITLADGEPEPDGAIVHGAPTDYSARHPSARDVAIVIEVADTTLQSDRGIKLRSYARAGIPTYWIFNLNDETVEVYTQPNPQAEPPTYLSRRVITPGEALDIELPDGTQVPSLPVSEFMQ